MATDAKGRSEGARQGKGRAYWFYRDLVTVHVSGEETSGRFCLVEFLQPPGEWTPLHIHRDSDQTQYVLEGELTVYLPGGSVAVAAGECINTPRNVPHTECVTSAGPARVLDVNAPSGFDKFVAAAGEPAAKPTLPPSPQPPPDLERLAALAAEHHIELLGPPGSTPPH